MVSILHRYVLRELAKSFLMSFLVVVTVMLLGAVYKPLRHGLGFGHLTRFLPYMLPDLLVWVIPAALLASCVMTYGRLSADNELVATSVSGIPLRYMCYPALAVAVALTAVTAPLNNSVVPACRLLKRHALKEIFIEQPFRISMIGGQETIELGDHKLFFDAVEDNVLRNVLVIAPRKPKPRAPGDPNRNVFAEQHREVYVYRARRAAYSVNAEDHTIRIELEDARYTIVIPNRNARSWLNLTADKQTIVIPVESGIKELHERRRTYLSRRQLHDRAAAARRRLAAATEESEKRECRLRLTRTLTELRRREALALSTFVLALVGVPLGIWMRRESRLASFGVGVIVFLVLYGLIAGGEGMALKQRALPWLALWGPDALIACLGVGLLHHEFRR
jgi:lipopolysaccharide export system permease protein